MEIITIKELEAIIVEVDPEKVKAAGWTQAAIDAMWMSHQYKQFKRHNRLDCTVWTGGIFPTDFKIFLTKKNVIKEAPLKGSKQDRIIGKRLVFDEPAKEEVDGQLDAHG